MTEAELISIPLGAGQDESFDDAFTPPTAMRVAQNVIYPTAQTATKRSGVTALATLANARALVKHGEEVLAIDGLNAWSWSPTEEAFVGRGRVPSCLVRAKLPIGQGLPANRIGRNDNLIGAPFVSLAETAAYRISVWNDGTSILASVYDLAGVFVRVSDVLDAQAGDQSYASYLQPRVLILATRVVALWFNTTGGAVYASSLDLTAIASGWSNAVNTTVVTGGSTTYFDACPIPQTGNFGMIVGDVSGKAVVAYLFSPSALTSPIATQIVAAASGSPDLSSATITAVACRPDWSGINQLFIYSFAYTTGPGTSTLMYYGVVGASLTGSPILANTSLTSGFGGFAPSPDSGPGVDTMGIERVYQEGTGTSSLFLMTTSYLVSQAGIPANRCLVTWQLSVNGSWAVLDTQLALEMTSKPFAITLNGVYRYCVLAMTSDPTRQGTAMLLSMRYEDISGAGVTPLWYPVATITPDYASIVGSSFVGVSSRSADVTHTTDPTQTVYTVSSSIATDALQNASVMFEIDFANVASYQSVELGPYAFIACGTPMIYDGSRLTEVGFLHAPPPPVCTFSSGGGSVPANASTQYLCCYAQQDSQGNVHRSAPSTVTNVDVSSEGNVVVNVVSYLPTYRQSGPGAGSSGKDEGTPIYVEVYRNTAANGSIYNLLARVPNNITAAPFQIVITSVTDVSPDSQIATNPVLYTETGQLPATPTPSLYGISVHSDRLFGCDADGITTYYSSALESGLAPFFADAFIVEWPEGPLTATWSLEGRFHAATANRIHFLYGDGPTDSGASSDFSAPALWQYDLGVVDCRSLVICQPGLIFLSQKGIYLETRANEYQWIGERVQRTLAASGGLVSSAVALDSDGSVRLSLGGSIGTVLAYNYRHDKWSTLIYSAPMVSSVVAGGTWYGLAYPGAGQQTLFEESATSSCDVNTVSGSSSWVTSTLTNGWALPGDVMQGWGEMIQAQVLLRQSSPCGISVTFSTDYENDPGPALTWSDAALEAFPTQPIVQLRPNTNAQQNAQAISFTITDSAPTTGALGTGQGVTFLHAQFMSREKRGPYPNIEAAGVQ